MTGALVRNRARPLSHKRYSTYALSFGSFCYDLLIVVASAPLLSYALHASGVSEVSADVHAARVTLGLYAGVLYAMFSIYLGAYNVSDILTTRIVLPRMLKALALTFGAFFLVGAALKITQNYSRIWFGAWMLTSMIVVLSTHALHLRHIRAALRARASVFGAYSVGYGCAPLSAQTIARNSGHEVRAMGSRRIEEPEHLRQLALDVQQGPPIDQIYIRTPWLMAPALMEAIDAFRAISAQVFVLPCDETMERHCVRTAAFGDHLAIVAFDRSIEGWAILWKRLQDVVFSGVILVFATPILLLTACAIRIESRGPLFFRQKRVGFNGRIFEIYKFRSMYADQADAHASRQTSRDDPRVTRVGRFIRATSIDELPQFLNVLRGDMSIVGPRPHALKTMTGGRDLKDVVDEYAFRHRVKPGITGLAQVNGARGQLDTEDKVRRRVEYDLQYIETWSTWLDFKIIVRTALLVVRDPSAF